MENGTLTLNINIMYGIWPKAVQKIIKRAKAKAKHCGQLFQRFKGYAQQKYYIIFLMYMNGTVIVIHCFLSVCIQHCPLRNSTVRND